MLYRENGLAKSMRMRSKYLLRKWYRVKRSPFGLFLLCLSSLNNCSIYYDSMEQSAKGTTLRKREATRPIKARCGRKADRCKAAPDWENKEIHMRVFFFTETEELCFSVFRTGSATVSVKCRSCAFRVKVGFLMRVECNARVRVKRSRCDCMSVFVV